MGDTVVARPKDVSPVVKQNRVFGESEVQDAIRLGWTMVFSLTKPEEFSAPIKLGGRMVGWRADAVRTWLEEREQTER